MSKPDILVIGGPDAGKTHYAGQLLGRFRHHRKGRLFLAPGGVDNLDKLEEILSCLEEGRSAGHTPGETWAGIQCQLKTQDGADVLLEWPEYAGERLQSLVDSRILSPEWRESVLSSQGWMLFIRPATLQLFEDLNSRPTGLKPQTAKAIKSDRPGNGWDDRARYVELLQMLLFAGSMSTRCPLRHPRLAIVFSCWDEFNEQKSPSEFLAKRLPMLDSFVRGNWEPNYWSVWGLSSLGRTLKSDASDSDYASQGPENFGYVINSENLEQDSDLTAPVAWLLGL